jgi:hypothetical protein
MPPAFSLAQQAIGHHVDKGFGSDRATEGAQSEPL